MKAPNPIPYKSQLRGNKINYPQTNIKKIKKDKNKKPRGYFSTFTSDLSLR